MDSASEHSQVLPDVLGRDLLIVFVGTAAGEESGRRGAYYAHPGNSFWGTLHAVGLTPRVLLVGEFKLILDFRIGLTDIAKLRSGSDASLCAIDFGVPAFRAQIERYAPQVVAFNGKKAASVFFGRPTSQIPYGKNSQKVGHTALWTLPSTSGGARGFWDIGHWQLLADSTRSASRQGGGSKEKM